MASKSLANTVFRIGAVNVHSFNNPVTNKSNAKELASILAPFNLDILAVEEVINNKDWQLLCNELGLTQSVFGASHGRTYGNAIGSRHPVIESTNVKSKTYANGGDRAMVRCRFGGDHLFVQNRRFAVTHLDHLDEDNRLTQIKEFSPDRHDINVLVGDMNALTRSDYSDHYYNQVVVENRVKSYWEMPRFELTQLITNTWGYQDALRNANPDIKDAQIATCPYGTRIDYIYLRPLPDDDWALKECFIVDTHQATDHHAVVATFEYRPRVTQSS